MKILKFEDIIAWQKSQNATVDIYSAFKDLKDGTLETTYVKRVFPFQIILQKVLIEVAIQILSDSYTFRWLRQVK